MRYIERDLPVEKLNAVALKEGNSKRPIYQIHKWWARRLGSIFRTIIIGTFSDETETAASTWKRFQESVDLNGKVVLDPFMGGGTTVIEALRLGCKVIGVDINPVAWFITKKEVEPLDLNALEKVFRQLEASVGAKIKSYYTTVCPEGHQADVMYYFWVKRLDCLNCSSRVQLFPSYEILHKNGTTTIYCPFCSSIFVAPRHAHTYQCTKCETTFDPTHGTAKGGKYSCPHCGHQGTVLDAVRKLGKPLDMDLFALEYHCKACGRGYKPSDEGDLALYEKAQQEFSRQRDKLLVPFQAIPTEGRSDPRPVNHGYTHFWQMFNERQLLCLSMLLESICQVQDQNIKEALLIAFSDSLDANNMFCKYEVDYQKISLLFGLHAYHPIERPAENNVWGSVFGRGTFVKCYEKLKRAKQYARAPFERDHIYGNGKHIPTGDQIEGRMATSFEELVTTDKNALLMCHDSRDLSLVPDNSVDAVITDPPYFDNVMYSELSDFFYVWLRLALKDTYPWFQPELPRRDVEIVQNPKLGNTIASFAAGLTSVLKECHRTLKPDGLLVFTFHHRQPWAWHELGQILLNAGFYVSGAPIVRSEGKSGFHSSEGNIKYDACLACRKRSANITRKEWETLKPEILLRSRQWAQRLLNSKMTLNPVDIFTITMAKLLEVYTPYWPNVTSSGQEVDLSKAIKEAHEIYQTLTKELLSTTNYIVAGLQHRLFERKADWDTSAR